MVIYIKHKLDSFQLSIFNPVVIKVFNIFAFEPNQLYRLLPSNVIFTAVLLWIASLPIFFIQRIEGIVNNGVDSNAEF